MNLFEEMIVSVIVKITFFYIILLYNLMIIYNIRYKKNCIFFLLV